MRHDWSSWFRFNEDKKLFLKGDPKGVSGIYRIRVVKGATQEPFTIRRLTGDDAEGLLQIGRSNDLKDRLETFQKRYKGRPGKKHVEGQRLCEIIGNGKFLDAFPHFFIEYSYIIIEKPHDVECKEQQHLDKYFKIFGELPPLNHSRPKDKCQ